MKQFLPIGSIVLLKGGTKRVMICGRVQQRVEDEKIFDYSGCLFPEGILNPKELFLFNNEDIELIYFIGFQDPEEFKFREYITQKIEENES